MRHKWDKNKPKEGYSTCRKCYLEVKNYMIKRGDLPRCDPGNPAKTGSCKENPDRHLIALMAGSKICWNCGKMYTWEELEKAKRPQVTE